MTLALDEPDDNEATTQVNGIDVLISDDVKGYAKNSVVDYGNSPYGERFTINSGNSCC